MNKHIVAEIVLGAVLLGCLCLIGWEQFDKALNARVAEQSAKIQQQADKKIEDTLAARETQYQKDSDAKDKAIKDAQSTIQKMADYTNKAVNPAKPIVVMQGPETVQLQKGDSVIPAVSAPNFFDAFAQGDKCLSTDLPKCQADAIDWQKRYQAKAEESAQWEKAAKGGSWFHRFKNDAIKVAIGVGIGYAIKH